MRNTVCILLLAAFLLIVRWLIVGINDDFGSGFVSGIALMVGLILLAEKVGITRPRY